MFDIFNNRKRDDVLRYIDHRLEVVNKNLQMSFEELRKIDGNSIEAINIMTMLNQQNREYLAVRDELRTIRRVIEHLYDH